MANPYQQQVFQRKLIYIGAIVVLLAASWLFRNHVVEARARDLGLLEDSRGDVEFIGAAARTGLSGLRGIATCALWMQAMEQQKKNQYSALERTVKQLTRLQPHLNTPWIFQSWNLAYNVSRECDSVHDKYFYISRGIQLLTQGERQNRFQPELRREIGYYVQQKVGQSDENNTFRSLFQLSCIPPVDRDPDNFRDAGGNIDLDTLQKFCAAHPQLARRLHSPPLPYDIRREQRKFRCGSAAEVVQFLADNYNIPSLYVSKLESEQGFKKGAVRYNSLDRFPVMPPPRDGQYVLTANGDTDPTEKDFATKTIPDETDPFLVARAWYGYAQECIPPPHDKLPAENGPITNPARQRVPHNMQTVIFRSSPARAQTFMAERLEEEGWYDDEPFTIRGWFDRPVVVGIRRQWSADAWRKANQMWLDFGRENHLHLSNPERANKERLAKAYRDELDVNPGTMPRIDPATLDERHKEMFDASMFMFGYQQGRQMTNFPHYEMRTRIEQMQETVKARKLMYLAEQDRIVTQDLGPALEKLEDPACLPAWRKILEENSDFRKDDYIQEQTFEVELKYVRLYRRLNEDKLAPDLALLAALGQSVAGGPGAADWTLLGLFSRPQLQPDLEVVGPFNTDSKGEPFISDSVKNDILVRRGLRKPPPATMPTPPEGQMPPGMRPPGQ